MDDAGQVASVVKDYVQGLATSEASDGLLNAPVVLLLGLALPCEDGDASRGDAKILVGEFQRQRVLIWGKTYAAAA